MLDVDKLLRVARAARNEGYYDWKFLRNDMAVYSSGEELVADVESAPIGKHIEAFNPSTVVCMLEEIRDLRKFKEKKDKELVDSV